MFALTCLVVGVVGLIVGLHNRYGCLSDGDVWPQSRCLGDDSGIYWGGALAVIGLLHLGLTGLAGSIVWTSAPSIAPRPPKRPAANVGENRVFSYGTLRQSEVQDVLFGEVVRTIDDSLPGWRLDWVTITDADVIRTSGSDRHPIIRRGTAEDRVDGAYLVLGREWQLSAVDKYEVADHQRIEVPLASGTTAWVYVAAEDA